jgi:3-hydroxy acid dehydrogenase/malonic semialdehyde reductase
MVETEFSVVRYRGDKARADNEYKGLTPRRSGPSLITRVADAIVSGDDIAEEIIWCASRPEHVQIAQMRKSGTPTNISSPQARSILSLT